SGLVSALCQKALYFFDSEPNVVAEFDGRQIAEASLFSDPRFRDTEKLGEFGRSQQCTRVAEASSRDTLAQHQGEQRALERLERGDARRDLGQEFWNRFENQTFGARWIGDKLVDHCGRQGCPRRNWVWRMVRHRRPPASKDPRNPTLISEESLSNGDAVPRSALNADRLAAIRLWRRPLKGDLAIISGTESVSVQFLHTWRKVPEKLS